MGPRRGPVARLIRRRGQEYTVRNGTTGGSARSPPTYSDDGSIQAVIERRSRQPVADQTSDGADVDSTLELRCVLEGSETIREAGSAAGAPTKLVPPDGRTFQVVARHREDSGVTVLTVRRD